MTPLNSNDYREFLEDETNFDESAAAFNFSVKSAIFQASQLALLKFGSLALLHPFESMKILRQVQYGTAVDVNEAGGFFEKSDVHDSPQLNHNEFADSSTSNDADDESDPLFMHKAKKQFEKEAQMTDEYFFKNMSKSSAILKVPELERVDVDENGYALSNTKKESINSKWPLILNKKASIWASIMLATKYQGIPSVWQGVFSFWAYQVTYDVTQAVFDEFFASQKLWNRPGGLLGYVYESSVSDVTTNNISNFPVVPISSSILLQSSVNYLMLPLDLARTRLVAQSVYSSEIKCKNILSTIKMIYREENGLDGLYPNKLFNFIASILQPTLRILPLSLFTHFADGWIETLGIPSGVVYTLAQFVFNCANMVITLPIETIRRRLFIQSSDIMKMKSTKARNWMYRVPISPTPYTGFWNCLRRICQEEGCGALYQGWSMQLTSNSVLMASNLILELENEYPDEMEAF